MERCLGFFEGEVIGCPDKKFSKSCQSDGVAKAEARENSARPNWAYHFFRTLIKTLNLPNKLIELKN